MENLSKLLIVYQEDLEALSIPCERLEIDKLHNFHENTVKANDTAHLCLYHYQSKYQQESIIFSLASHAKT